MQCKCSTINEFSYWCVTSWTMPLFLFTGYGHIAPTTPGGRVFCVFYALIGIPLSLVVLGGLGMRLSGAAGKLDAKLNKGIFPPRVGKALRALLLFLIGFCLFVLVPAAILTSVEDWTYGNALYYAMITLTTIGFGDFVAGKCTLVCLYPLPQRCHILHTNLLFSS